MFETIKLSVEALAARNLGDEDWEDLIPHTSQGCSRKATAERDNDHEEREPNIDKFTPDQLHNARHA